ncbi:MAG: hypothetical protein CM1200mP41_37310 [Gammaproteobacteria bacterium]|nr:MAG: hypothetical protein CM1200mP41_37310 [Gammaproteobacteria bacterium]
MRCHGHLLSACGLKVDEISKWFTGNMSPGSVTCPYVMNTKAWDKLPKEYQDALISGNRQPMRRSKRLIRPRMRRICRISGAMQEIRYTAAELAEFRKIGAKPVWDAWLAEASAAGAPGPQELLVLNFLSPAGD